MKLGKKVRFLTETEKPGRVETDRARPEDFHFLIGKIYRADEDWLLYKTMKIYVHKYTDDIVGGRAHVFNEGTISKTYENNTINVCDFAKLSEQYELETVKNVLNYNLVTYSEEYDNQDNMRVADLIMRDEDEEGDEEDGII